MIWVIAWKIKCPNKQSGVIKQTCDDPQIKDKFHDTRHKDLHNYNTTSRCWLIAQKNSLVGKPVIDILDFTIALPLQFTI